MVGRTRSLVVGAWLAALGSGCGESAATPPRDRGPSDLGAADEGPAETRAPALTATLPPSPAASPTLVLVGGAEAGAMVRVYGEASCAGDPLVTFEAAGPFGLELTVEQGETVFSADASLPDRDPSACSAPLAYRFDPTLPGRPVLRGTEPASPSTAETPQVVGTSDPDQEIRVFADAGCAGEPVARVTAGGDGSFAAAVTVSLGETVFTARATAAGGQESSCSAPLRYRRLRRSEPIFPPGPAVTELERITLRARVDVPPIASVRFVGPSESVEATYDDTTETFVAEMPLVEGAQVIAVETDEAIDTFEIAREVIPRRPTALALDPATDEVLLGDGARVLGLSLSTGRARLRADATSLVERIEAIALVDDVLFALGRNLGEADPLLIRVDGSGPRVLARLPSGGLTGPRTTLVAREPDELFVHAPAGAVVFVDRETGALRTADVGSSRCNGVYLPTSDEVLLCPGFGAMASPEFRLLDAATLTLRDVTGLASRVASAAELRYDARAGLPLVRTLTSELLAIDPAEGTATVEGVLPNLSSFTVRAADGLLVGLPATTVTGSETLVRTYDRTGDTTRDVVAAPLGRGAPLGVPVSVARAGDVVLVADGNRALRVSLGFGAGERRVVASAPGASWTALALDPEANALFIAAADGALSRLDLQTEAVQLVARRVLGAMGTDVALGGGRLLDVSPSRLTVTVRPLDDLDTPLELGPFEPESPGAMLTLQGVAFDGERDDVLVLLRSLSTAGSNLQLVGRPADGTGMPRAVPGLIPLDTFGGSSDLAWNRGTAFVAVGATLRAIDVGSGTERYRRELPGDLQQLAGPGDDGVGFAVTTGPPGLLAFDEATGDFAYVAR